MPPDEPEPAEVPEIDRVGLVGPEHVQQGAGPGRGPPAPPDLFRAGPAVGQGGVELPGVPGPAVVGEARQGEDPVDPVGRVPREATGRRHDADHRVVEPVEVWHGVFAVARDGLGEAGVGRGHRLEPGGPALLHPCRADHLHRIPRLRGGRSLAGLRRIEIQRIERKHLANAI